MSPLPSPDAPPAPNCAHQHINQYTHYAGDGSGAVGTGWACANCWTEFAPKGAAPALPVGRATPYAWLTKSKATGEWLNWGADKPSEWVTVKNADLFDVIPLYLAPPVSSRFDRESLGKIIHDGLGWNGLADWHEKDADHPDLRQCLKVADAILSSLTGGEPPK